MAVTIYHEQDCDPSIIQGKKVAIIGYGSQGHAHALNLMDSGCDVRVGLREGSSSADKAREAGLKVTDMATAVKDETEEDLFGEQAVLCGGLVEMIKAGFETLTEAGYPEELAYFEVYHEMKMIVDLMYESGIHFMNYSISNTAEYGEYYAGPKVINKQSREAMKEILRRIQNGEFAQEFVDDCNNDHKWLLEQREAINSHPIEVTGEKIRSMFSWIKK